MLAISLVLMQAMAYLDAGSSVQIGFLIPLVLVAALLVQRQPKTIWVGLAGLLGGMVMTWLVTLITGGLH